MFFDGNACMTELLAWLIRFREQQDTLALLEAYYLLKSNFLDFCQRLDPYVRQYAGASTIPLWRVGHDLRYANG
jgi:hypothetical protein